MEKSELEEIKNQALKEIQEENFKKKVEEYKQYLRTKKPFWFKIFPFRIKIERIKK